MSAPCCQGAVCSDAGVDHRFRKASWVALCLNAAMFMVELGASWSSGSVSLLADAIDFFGDAGNYAISLAVLGGSLAARARAALITSSSPSGDNGRPRFGPFNTTNTRSVATPVGRSVLMYLATVAKKLGDKSFFVFDANSDKTYAQGHVPGAKHISFDDYTADQLPGDKGSTLVFYCMNTQCSASHEAANRAAGFGYKHVYVMPQGIQGWKDAHLPTVAGKDPGTAPKKNA